MLEIFNLSVRLGVKSLVFQSNGPRQTSQVYWLVAAGSKVALTGLFAAMAGGRVAWLDGVDAWQKAELTFPWGGGMSAMYKRMQTGTYAAAFYHSTVKLEDEKKEGDLVLLVKDQLQKEQILYKVINGRVAYPLHPSWSGWMWTYLLEQKSDRAPVVVWRCRGIQGVSWGDRGPAESRNPREGEKWKTYGLK